MNETAAGVLQLRKEGDEFLSGLQLPLASGLFREDVRALPAVVMGSDS